MPKKKKPPLPKPRRGWAINPKTRVEPSGKEYKRAAEKQKERSWEEEESL